jgi:hypothetical protein
MKAMHLLVVFRYNGLAPRIEFHGVLLDSLGCFVRIRRRVIQARRNGVANGDTETVSATGRRLYFTHGEFALAVFVACSYELRLITVLESPAGSRQLGQQDEGVFAIHHPAPQYSHVSHHARNTIA